MSRYGWWASECPARGAALSHAHWDKCTPEGHPGEDSGHMRNQCCHCRGIAPDKENTPEPIVAPDRPPMEDHLYIFSVTGKCVRCQRTQDAHPAVMQVEPRAPGACAVDHASLHTALLINDGGLEWRRCPVCNSMIEPKLATGSPVGAPWGIGRGPITARLSKRLGFRRWLAARMDP